MFNYTTPVITAGVLEKAMMRSPHCLLAGTTGSGKSVLLRRCLCLCAAWGYDTVLIDPKNRELVQWKDAINTWGYANNSNNYENIVSLLQNCVDLMHSRFAMMQGWDRDWNGKQMWIIIDEWADIYFNAKQAAKLVMNIAAMGRAAGIHVLLCTQHPSAKIIDGMIKANFPVRVALHVASATYSRMIIERKGAEDLPYRGYAYMMHESGELELFETKMLDPMEERRVCDYMTDLRRQYNEYKKALYTPQKKKSFFARLFG